MVRIYFSFRLAKRASGAVLAAALLTLGGASAARAQNVLSPATTEKLHHPIVLQSGSITLEVIAAQLSQQTGLQIEAAPYLSRHRLTLQCEGDSAESVLGTLAELNEWQWQEVDKGRIVISRALGRSPQGAADIPAAVQRAMPIDARRYLHVGSEDKVGGIQPIVSIGVPAHDKVERTLAIQKAVRNRNAVQSEAGKLYTVQALAEKLKPKILDGSPIYYRQMTDEQRYLWTGNCVIYGMNRLGDIDTYNVIYDCLPDCYIDQTPLFFEMPGPNSLNYMMAKDGKASGGGVEIDDSWFAPKPMAFK